MCACACVCGRVHVLSRYVHCMFLVGPCFPSRYGNSHTIELRVKPPKAAIESAVEDIVHLCTSLETALGVASYPADALVPSPADSAHRMRSVSELRLHDDLVVEASNLPEALKVLCRKSNGDVAIGVVSSLVTEISPTGSGWALYNSLHQHGYVHVSDLVEWFTLLQQSAQLDRFLEATFDGVKRVFQQGERHRCGLSCRVCIRQWLRQSPCLSGSCCRVGFASR